MYRLRKLYQEELEQFYDHCAEVFDPENNLPGLRKQFVKSWQDDPNRDIESIQVAVDGHGWILRMTVTARLSSFRGNSTAKQR